MTTYHVKITPGDMIGAGVQWVLDLVSDQSAPDSLQIANFAHDGNRVISMSPTETFVQGGPVSGDLFGTANPATLTQLNNGAFHNFIVVPFDSLGSRVTFDLTIPQLTPATLGEADQVSMFCYKRNGSYMFSTADPLGTNALVALGVTSSSGGDLSVFSPMTFIAPDTLALDMTGVGVLPTPHATARLQFRRIAPNPSSGVVKMALEVPSSGLLRLRVYDVAGRLVAEPFNRVVSPGPSLLSWNGTRTDGRRVSAGVYLVRADSGGQTTVRRVVLVR